MRHAKRAEFIPHWPVIDYPIDAVLTRKVVKRRKAKVLAVVEVCSLRLYWTIKAMWDAKMVINREDTGMLDDAGEVVVV